jgi:hypothetical protein
MKAYLVITGILIGLIAAMHVWRSIEEFSRLSTIRFTTLACPHSGSWRPHFPYGPGTFCVRCAAMPTTNKLLLHV